MENSDSVVTAERNRKPRSSPFLLFLVIILGTIVAAGALWATYFRVTPIDNTAVNLNTTGFHAAIVTKLDPQFTDADSDLLADTPTDPKQLVDPETLKFSFIAQDEPEKMQAEWKPFADYLSKATGKPVEIVLFTSAEAELKAMKEGKLHVAAYNTGNVPAAVNLTGFIPVCAIPTPDGTALLHTEIIVPPDSLMAKPVDLKGHELTLTDPGSNSGYKAPLVLLRSNYDIQPMTDIHLRYSGSHESSIKGVAGKKYEAAAVASDMLGRAMASGEIKPGQFRTIYKSESFPTGGLGYVYNLTPELANKIRAALLSYDWKGTGLEAQFNSGSTTKFSPVNYKNDWSLIRRIDEEMGSVPKID